MIASRENLCWVDAGAEQYEPFDRSRLVASLRRAAGSDAEEAAEVAESVAVAVEHFAVDHREDRTLTREEIGEMVEALLGMLGFADWARTYAQRSRRLEISLDLMAAETMPGFELGFYRRLDAALAGVMGKTLGMLRLRGLRDCVLRLRGTQRWSGGCRRLADEIVAHVQARAAQVPGVNIAVVE